MYWSKNDYYKYWHNCTGYIISYGAMETEQHQPQLKDKVPLQRQVVHLFFSGQSTTLGLDPRIMFTMLYSAKLI